MRRTIIALAGLLILLPPLSLSALESVKRPILYPNAHYEIMGQATAQEDVEDCWE